MIGGCSVLGLIAARGGSKGVPRKNLKFVGGKPLIAWTVEAARRAETVDRVILSSDDAEIAQVARAHGCEVPFVRPAELATDEAMMLDVVRHAIRILEKSYDYVVLLQPTSPLRAAGDIDAAVGLCHENKAVACVSVCEPEKSPFWNFFRDDRAVLSPVLAEPKMNAARRQELPPTFVLNGAVYVARSEWILQAPGFVGEETLGYVMPRERSIDIDREMDFAIVEALLSWNGDESL